MKSMFERWMRDVDTWIAVYENHDFGSPQFGRRIALPCNRSQWDAARIGKSCAPSHPDIGRGWRYILIAKCDSVDDAAAIVADAHSANLLV